MAKRKTEAVAYFRTSSATNVGGDKDSLPRQQSAVAAYAKANRIQIIAEYYDPAVSGADLIETRPGFADMLAKIEGNGVRLVLVEDKDRFARELMTQELGLLVMIKRGVRVVTSHGEDLTETDDPARVMIRQVGGAFMQFEKARLVAKLRVARERKRTKKRRCEGRPAVPEHVVKLARKAARQPRRLSYRQIAKWLASAGHVGVNGAPYAAQSVKLMLSPAQQAARQR